ncbi:hypothetical protein COL36_10320 [Bacillus wiedmannii]|nr:hypothetical protein COL36_10320 [Bacillus wiedmannii]
MLLVSKQVKYFILIHKTNLTLGRFVNAAKATANSIANNIANNIANSIANNTANNTVLAIIIKVDMFEKYCQTKRAPVHHHRALFI